MIKTLVLVPIRDNDGQPFSPADWDLLERKLLERFGGFTGGGLAEGAWSDETGKVYRDVSRRYEVALSSWNQLPDWLAIVHWIRVHFRQIAVYIEVAGIPEIIGE